MHARSSCASPPFSACLCPSSLRHVSGQSLGASPFHRRPSAAMLVCGGSSSNSKQQQQQPMLRDWPPVPSSVVLSLSLVSACSGRRGPRQCGCEQGGMHRDPKSFRSLFSSCVRLLAHRRIRPVLILTDCRALSPNTGAYQQRGRDDPLACFRWAM
jgi:hypothetical protein